jgi:hypothetical protein
VDERRLPTWIIVEVKQAQRREKQGDACGVTRGRSKEKNDSN